MQSELPLAEGIGTGENVSLSYDDKLMADPEFQWLSVWAGLVAC